jgi:hypothetical protein
VCPYKHPYRRRDRFGVVERELRRLGLEANLFGPGTWGWITGYTLLCDVDVDFADIDHALARLPALLASAIEGQDAAGPVFLGKVYRSPKDADEALSRAAVRVGREAAGLPPLAETPTTVTT